MKLVKSLLLGSAAGLCAVAGAPATAAKAAAEPSRELFKSFIDISKSFETHKTPDRQLSAWSFFDI